MASGVFKDLILNHLLPEFCNDPRRSYDLAGFRHNFGQVDDVDADNFMKALDAGLVKLDGRLYRAPRSCAGEQFFWEHKKALKLRPITIWIEPIITVATLWKLHFELGWPKELLGTQSIDYAFDAAAYADADSKNEYIACEVKKTTQELDSLVRTMRKFAALPVDAIVSEREKNAFKKIVGLRNRRAPLFWAVGPGGNSLAFKLSYSGDGLIAFDEALIRDLRHPHRPLPS
ncbi:hypothetical protein [Ensifer sp. LCM 4579]|uniref:hypothetical protein n=1 Tax=Ensifer sp. LCM 4579 TaxID=1848292 RepID=UPI0008D949FB|nr:hypothetical protein [Ensifer sp. LCM 4579]OHV77998.1 hypothetical protein LCM4579_06530 [Ensifer sp. LCM 4579]